jgi:molybdopterin converting factor small subunit
MIARSDRSSVERTPSGVGSTCRLVSVPTLRLFASAREAAGTGSDVVDGATVREVLSAAEARYGARFADVLGTCRVWVNGEDISIDAPVGQHDEVAVLPPVSGGST